MEPLRRHKGRPRTIRILSQVLIVLLSAVPVLAVVDIAPGCAQCDCCRAGMNAAMQDAGFQPTGCCGRQEAQPCQMKAQNPADPLLALVHSRSKSQNFTVHPLFSTSHPEAVPSAPRSPHSPVSLSPPYPPPDIYLSVCRLIC